MRNKHIYNGWERIFLVVCFISQTSHFVFAQFAGGSYDGYAINSVTCTPAPGANIFAGGSYDGFAINSLTCTPAGANIFAGGSYDGFAINSVTCTPAPIANIFAGASYDGFYVNYFSTLTGCGPVPFPVELLLFHAKPNGKVVEVKWATATEMNNDYFTIEKTIDLYSYEDVGKISGAGNSSVPLHYALIDDHPFHGISYYRLTQTDFNGQYKTYGPVAVQFHFSGIAVYPTISTGTFYITGNEGNMEIVIYNVYGEKTYSSITNNLPITSINLDVPSGIYFVKVRLSETKSAYGGTTKGEVAVKKIIIQK
ncbi:MAG: T9SS type A sorting domain-containing protein [Bacteroidetes bacterium]|nr:MAG: T9SS type A sorting domain-containing protein [Bacteroidota bacterium]